MSEEELPIPIVPEPKVNRWENFKRQIKFYITAVFLLAAIFSVTAFLFLVPFVIDPAYSLIMADLIEDPVTCYVFETSYRLGTSNCSWSSCREGCTKDLTECFHIHVRYTSEIEVNPNYTDQPLVLEGQKVIDYWHGLKWDESEARLFINIKGCIYPSVVLDCSKWGSKYGPREDYPRVFPCYYSRVNTRYVVPYYNLEEAYDLMVYSTVVPIVVFVVSCFVLSCMYCTGLRRRCFGGRPSPEVSYNEPEGDDVVESGSVELIDR